MLHTMKRALLVLLALVMTLSVSLPAFGNSDIQAKIDQAAKEKQAAIAARNKAQGEMTGIMAQVTKLDEEAEIINAEVAAIDAIIAETDEKIAAKEAEIAEFERQIEEKNDVFKARLRAMDETNATGYIDLLLDSSSLSDFINRIETLREITAYDRGIINEMIDLKKNVEKSRDELVKTREEQEAARALVKTKQDELNKKIAEKTSYMKSLEKDIAKYKQMEDAAEAQMESLKRSVSGSTGSVGSSGRIEYSGGIMCWPAPSYTYISSPYGYRIHPIYGTKKFHSGVDMAAPGGSPILAAADGVVTFSGWNGGYGNCLIIDHGNGISTLYGHASKLLVGKGARVSRGQKVALVGTTGASTGNHLHFEVLNNGATTDPMAYLR